MEPPKTDTSSWPTFVLACFGALSWLPIIYTAIHRRFEKTQLDVFLARLLQIVENEHNVILSIRIGILTKIKDSFIENMTLVTEHVNGEKRSFKWARTVELITQTDINDTIMPTNRILNGIGYNLPKNTFTEPLVNFTSPTFRDKHDELANKLRNNNFYIIQNKSSRKAVEGSEPFIEMCNNYRRHYTWPSGDYKATLTIYTSDKQSFSRSFKFNIDEPNAQTFIELNIHMVIDKLKNMFAREEAEKIKTYDDSLLEGGLPFKIEPL